MKDLLDPLQKLKDHDDVLGHVGALIPSGRDARQGDTDDGGNDGLCQHSLAIQGGEVINGCAKGREGEVMILKSCVDVSQGSRRLVGGGDMKRCQCQDAVH